MHSEQINDHYELFVLKYTHFFGNQSRMFIASGCVVKWERKREMYSQTNRPKYKWNSRELMHGMRNWKTEKSRQAFIFIACHLSIFVLSFYFAEAMRWRVAVMIAWMNRRPHSASSHIRLVSAVIQKVPPFSSSICIIPLEHRAYDKWCYKQRRFG